MKKSKFSATQVAAILKEFDNGKSVEDISREHSVSRATFYKWRQGMGVWKQVSLSELRNWKRKMLV
ncbi:MAG: transposase [Bacteroidetes bacterium]|nr:transposase [Bacteroidota bacterium]